MHSLTEVVFVTQLPEDPATALPLSWPLMSLQNPVAFLVQPAVSDTSVPCWNFAEHDAQFAAHPFANAIRMWVLLAQV